MEDMTMRRNWIVVAAAFACAALLTAGSLTAEEPKKDDKAPAKGEVTLKQIKEMMLKVHRGEKAPLMRTPEELKKDTPDWEQLAKDGKEFATMSDMLSKAGLYTDSTKYVSSSTELSKAVGEKDKKAASEAFNSLNKTCGNCHYHR
jgi:hypothetical protein